MASSFPQKSSHSNDTPIRTVVEPAGEETGDKLNEKVAFCTIANDYFASGAIALIRSIHRYAAGFKTFVLDGGLSDANKKILADAGAEVVRYKRAIPIDHPRFGPAYALFDIGLIPYETVIYLDADMLVVESLNWLIEEAYTSEILVSGANSHLSLKYKDYKMKLTALIKKMSEEQKGIISSINADIIKNSESFQNINTGALCIKTGLMRTIAENAKVFSGLFDQLENPDQELLSIVLAHMNKQPKNIPWCYNATYCHGTSKSKDGRLRTVTTSDLSGIKWTQHFDDGKLNFYATNEDSGQKTKIFIIHYITKDKPWIDGNCIKPEYRIIWKHFSRGRVPPYVSIIVPIYNVAAYIRKCILSIKTQTYPNIEVILVDDESADDSMRAAKRAAADLKNVRIVTHEYNQGLSEARNHGMDVATGKYIFFLDSDDWLAPDAIELAVEKAEKGNSDIVVVDYYRANANGKLVQPKDRTPYADEALDSFDPATHQNILRVLNLAQIKLYSREFLSEKSFRFTKNTIYEDIDWHFKTLTAASRVSVIDKPLYFYRDGRPGSILSTPGNQHFDVLSQYKRVFEYVEENNLDHFFETIYSYAVNAMYSVLFLRQRIELSEREKFFYEAQNIFRYAKRGKSFSVTLWNRGWFERVLLNYSYRRAKLHVGWHRLRNPLKINLWRSIFRNYLSVRALKRLTIQKIARNILDYISKTAPRSCVVFESYWGSQFSDSPKYLYEYIKKNHPEVKCYFALKKGVSCGVDSSDRLLYNSFSYFKKISNSKVLVNNNNFPNLFKKSAGSLFIQTFHGVPIKYIGTDLVGYADGEGTNWKELVKRSGNWDLFTSAGAHHTETIRGAFQSNAKFVECGSPRTDCLQDAQFRCDSRSAVRAYFNLPNDCRLILYAPTWRLNSKTSFLSSAELERLASDAGPNTFVLVRQHHFSSGSIGVSVKVKDASDYPEVQALCAASDLLITDYSSIAFDYATTGGVPLFYIPDFNTYSEIRGLYIDISEKFPSLAHKSFLSLLEKARFFLSDHQQMEEANLAFVASFLEAERPDTCRHIVEKYILPHLDE